MKFVLVSYGTRGDVEPCAALGRELLGRGHEVRMAVPPDLVGFAESAGLAVVAYGQDSQTALDRDLGVNVWKDFPRSVWRIQDLIRLWREFWEFVTQCWGEVSTTLTSLADGADLLFTGLAFEQAAANVAEYYDIPLATLHYFPLRASGAALNRSAVTVYEWLSWCVTKKLEDAQRRELGLPKATGPAARRITERGSLEIQAYD
ncbi:MAG TPA: glycosyltransferase, partial [Mycobacterium sp.]|uniref:glycosyltransferase n=1 Tax=Mycobacterium sp. TaxID=1785 RepID=UPI002D638D3E